MSGGESYRAGVAAAFKPFADFMAGGSFDKLPVDFRLTTGSSMARRQLTAGDLRKLADAISANPTTDDRSAITALRKLAIAGRQRPGVQRVELMPGGRCRVCRSAWERDGHEQHRPGCPLEGSAP